MSKNSKARKRSRSIRELRALTRASRALQGDEEHEKTMLNSLMSARRKVQAAKSRKHKSETFLTQETAKHNVMPMLNFVAQLVRKRHDATVPGWINRLSMWLIRMERGNYHDARTPFFRRMSYPQIASFVMNIVHSNHDKVAKEYSDIPKFADTLSQVEEHQSEKIAPRGIFPPAHVWVPKKVKEIWTDKPPRKELDREALKRSLQWLSTLRPKGIIDVDESSIKEGLEPLELLMPTRKV